jgi:alpha-galactosidase/6-phospho-beta-glucosidase family protein
MLLLLLPARGQGVMEDGELWLKIHWVGYDTPTWDTCDQLNAHPADYDYLSDETRQWVVARYEALQQQQQQQEEEQQEQEQEQQQQQRKRQLRSQQVQRRTTRRSAAAGSSSNVNSSSRSTSSGGSSSSSSRYTNPLLEDGCSED